MPIRKLQPAIAVVLGLSLAPTVAAVVTWRPADAVENASGAEDRVKASERQEGEQGPIAVWGKEVGGLQAGLGLRPGKHRDNQHGQSVTLVISVRNVSKEEVKFQYLKEFIRENPPVVTDAGGKTVQQASIDAGGLIHRPIQVSLAPGKEIELADVGFEFRSPNERDRPLTGKIPPLYGTGKVTIQYERIFGDSSAGKIKIDPNLKNLTSGKLELEIKSTPAAGTEKK